jgi:hypothetical protein
LQPLRATRTLRALVYIFAFWPLAYIAARARCRQVARGALLGADRSRRAGSAHAEPWLAPGGPRCARLLPRDRAEASARRAAAVDRRPADTARRGRLLDVFDAVRVHEASPAHAIKAALVAIAATSAARSSSGASLRSSTAGGALDAARSHRERCRSRRSWWSGSASASTR